MGRKQGFRFTVCKFAQPIDFSRLGSELWCCKSEDHTSRGKQMLLGRVWGATRFKCKYLICPSLVKDSAFIVRTNRLTSQEEHHFGCPWRIPRLLFALICHARVVCGKRVCCPTGYMHFMLGHWTCSGQDCKRRASTGERIVQQCARWRHLFKT